MVEELPNHKFLFSLVTLPEIFQTFNTISFHT
jgi:hypothetical protein